MKDLHGTRCQIVIYFAQRRLLTQRTLAFMDHVRATVPTSAAFQASQRAMADR